MNARLFQAVRRCSQQVAAHQPRIHQAPVERAVPDEAPCGRKHRRLQSDQPALAGQAARKIQVLENVEISEPTEPLKNLPPREDRLVPQVPPEPPVAPPRQPAGEAQPARRGVVAPREGTSDHVWLPAHGQDLSERSRRQQSVGVQEKQEVTARLDRTVVHLRGALRSWRSDHPASPCTGHRRRTVATACVHHDDLEGLPFSGCPHQGIEGDGKRVCFVEGRNDDGQHTKRRVPRGFQWKIRSMMRFALL